MIEAFALHAASAPQTAPSGAPQWLAASGDNTTAAVLIYGEGASISVLCRDNQLQFFVGGLPAVTTATRTLQINYREGPLQNSTWIAGSDQTTAISTSPGVMARRLLAGGQFTVRVPPEGGVRGRRYEMHLPGDATALGAVLDACEVERERAEDAEYDPTKPVITWEQAPAPEFPRDFRSRSASVAVACIAEPGGGLRECKVDPESPADLEFRRAALASTRRARIRAIDGGPVLEDQAVAFTIRFRIAR